MHNQTIAVCSEKSGEAKQLEWLLRCKIQPVTIEIFETYQEFLDTFQSSAPKYDLIFLGISENNRIGIEAARRVREESIFYPLVLICDIDKYYRDAFDVLAFSYLERPLDSMQLDRVLQGLLRFLSKRAERVVHFQHRSQMHSLPLYRIAYISSCLYTVNFHLTDDQELSCRGKLCDFCEQFDNSLMVRCHQSFFVNLEHITSMKNDSCFIGETEVPISRAYSKQVQDQYKQYLASISPIE